MKQVLPMLRNPTNPWRSKLLLVDDAAAAAAAAAVAAADAANLALRLALNFGDLLNDSESESEMELREAVTRPDVALVVVARERVTVGRRSATGDATLSRDSPSDEDDSVDGDEDRLASLLV